MTQLIRQATVFGGTGFLGRALVQRLARQGAQVRLPTRQADKVLSMMPMGGVGQIVPWPAVALDEAKVAEAIAGSDLVVNLIGALTEESRGAFQSLHIETAARLARVAKDMGAEHFLHVSAMGISPRASSRYARTKAFGEDAVRAFFPEAVILRPSVVFGPRDKFLNRFATLARMLPVLPLLGGGTSVFAPVYVGDVAQAAMLALADKAWQGQIFELGGPATYTLAELLTLVMATIKTPRPFLKLSWGASRALAGLAGMLPHPFLTPDLIELLRSCSAVPSGQERGFQDLDLAPVALETMLPSYLS